MALSAFCLLALSLLSAGNARAAETAGLPETPAKLIVIGFMGGRVSADNLVHREALMARDLQAGHPETVNALMFANHDGQQAYRTVLRLLHPEPGGELTAAEKENARIVIFGHSWGASETVALANRLDKLNIPVLLTVQVDSVEKQHENDERIPANVHEAINFYQSEGLLHGRQRITAADPLRTRVLGNYESSYRKNPVSCDGYPWFARAFMKQHIEIENDPQVWDRIEALILSQLPPRQESLASSSGMPGPAAKP